MAPAEQLLPAPSMKQECQGPPLLPMLDHSCVDQPPLLLPRQAVAPPLAGSLVRPPDAQGPWAGEGPAPSEGSRVNFLLCWFPAGSTPGKKQLFSASHVGKQTDPEDQMPVEAPAGLKALFQLRHSSTRTRPGGGGGTQSLHKDRTGTRPRGAGARAAAARRP